MSDTAKPAGLDPWDAEGQEILERAQERIEALYKIATEAGDVEAELLQEELEVLELLTERGREGLDPGGLSSSGEEGTGDVN